MKQITARKIFALLLSFVGILFLATSCAKSNAKHESYGSSKETGTEILSAAGLSEYEIEKYFDSFADFFLPDDYLRLYELAERESATPQRCLSHSLFLAEQDFSTYNSKNKKGVLMDTSGNIIRECPLLPDYPYAIGAFFLMDNGNPMQYDVLNESGVVVNAVEIDGNPSIVADLGNGYYLLVTVQNLSRSSYDLYIFHPTGDCFPVMLPSGYWNADISMNISDEDQKYVIDATFGNVAEDKFSILYSRYMVQSKVTCAYYCDIYGNILINLSSDITNYNVFECGDFSGGQATIKLWGADICRYAAVIDENGEFVREPTPLT